MAARWLRSRRRRTRQRVPLPSLIARAVLGTALVVLCVIVLWWWAIGGMWFTVRTPSMGRAAPVGTLVWVKPANIRDIHVGDIVTFHTPTVTNQGPGVTSPPVRLKQQTYTHRVVGRYPGGALKTQGDLNAAPDPWRTDQQHLVGRVAARWWGIGWLVKALPLLILGGIAWCVLTGLLASRRSRAPLRVLGAAALVAGAIYLYNPLFGAQQLLFVPIGPHSAKATYVGTGLMPWKLHAAGAHSVMVHTGEAASIIVPYDKAGRFHVQATGHIPWQTWPIVVLACLIPALWSVIVGVEPPPHRRGRKQPQQPTAPPPTPQLQAS